MQDVVQRATLVAEPGRPMIATDGSRAGLKKKKDLARARSLLLILTTGKTWWAL